MRGNTVQYQYQLNCAACMRTCGRSIPMETRIYEQANIQLCANSDNQIHKEILVSKAGRPHTQYCRESAETNKLDLIGKIEAGLRQCGARCQQHLTKLGHHCPHCQHQSCIACNDNDGRTQCSRCQTPFPHTNPVHQQQVRAHACAPPCLNMHALGEQWIEKVSDVDIAQPPQEDSHEGDQLVFKAHIRGWETDDRRTRYQYLKGKL